MNRKVFIFTIVLCLAGNWGWAAAAANTNLTLQPEHVKIGAGYNGEHITVAGQIPADATALIRVTGKVEDYELKKKGRAFGLLWMNLGSVKVSNAPDVFQLYLPEASTDSAFDGHTEWQNLDIGFQGVRKQADIVAEDGNQEGLFEEFIKLKQKSGLYATTTDAIHFGPPNGPMKSFKAVLAMPAALPQGKFKVEVFALKDNAVVDSATHIIDAREVGMPAWISSMAFDHGTLYGVMAVMVAVMAGFLTGILFKDQEGAH